MSEKIKEKEVEKHGGTKDHRGHRESGGEARAARHGTIDYQLWTID
ncbi:MAG: hypothetical protein ACRD6I_15700 [Candidatus Acidiferrales bacterium]